MPKVKTTKKPPVRARSLAKAPVRNKSTSALKKKSIARKTIKSKVAPKKSIFTLHKRFLQYLSLEAILVFGVSMLIASTGLFYVMAATTTQTVHKVYLKNSNTTGNADFSYKAGSDVYALVACNWDGGEPKESIGYWNPNDHTIHIRHTTTEGGSNLIFSYGQTGDLAVCGDWNGDGTDTIGIYRPSTTSFYLKNSNSSGVGDITIKFGNNGDLPLAGDWNGDGKDEVGLYRPSTRQFFVRSSLATTTAPYETVTFGNSGDKPLAGDWNGDGKDTIGLHRPSNNTFYLRSANVAATSTPYETIAYGIGGDTPVVGDWDGNKSTTLGLFRKETVTTTTTAPAPTTTTTTKPTTTTGGTTTTSPTTSPSTTPATCPATYYKSSDGRCITLIKPVCTSLQVLKTEIAANGSPQYYCVVKPTVKPSTSPTATKPAPGTILCEDGKRIATKDSNVTVEEKKILCDTKPPAKTVVVRVNAAQPVKPKEVRCEENPTLRIGSKLKECVKVVQTLLRDRYQFKQQKVNGDFDARTKTNIEVFQRNRDLDVDGIVGPVTWKFLRTSQSVPNKPATTAPPSLKCLPNQYVVNNKCSPCPAHKVPDEKGRCIVEDKVEVPSTPVKINCASGKVPNEKGRCVAREKDTVSSRDVVSPTVITPKKPIYGDCTYLDKGVLGLFGWVGDTKVSGYKTEQECKKFKDYRSWKAYKN